MDGEKIDIAISFLANDEDIAQEIEGSLSKFFNVFIYSKRQEELAGTDGMESFSDVFKSRSKTVLVLYRKDWGNTKWTAVEMNAIKDRCFNSSGFDFLLFIPLEKASLPSWIPESIIYYDYQVYGLNGLVPVIHSHLKRNGVNEKKSGLEAIISATDKKLSYEEQLNAYFYSQESADDFNNEIELLNSLFPSRVQHINDTSEKINIVFRTDRDANKIIFKEYELGYYSRLRSSNTSKDSVLEFKLFKGIHTGYEAPNEKPVHIETFKFVPALDSLLNFVWNNDKLGNLTTSQLVDKMLELLIDAAINNRSSRFWVV